MLTAAEAEARLLALALPEAYEDQHRGKPAFRVKARVFMMLRGEGPLRRTDSSMFGPLDGEAPVALVKLTREDQLNLVAAHPEAIRETAEYAHHGWTHLRLDALSPEHLALVIRLAWVAVAPKRLAKSL
jgi:hypothetical protein